MTGRLAILSMLACMVWPAAAPAEAPDWAAAADVRVVNVVTLDEDGDTRDTKVWLAVVDGQGYIRTGGTTWGDNVERDPLLVLRIEGTEYPLRAEFVEDDAQREGIVASFREKYGWTDGMFNIFRGSRPRIMRLLPR
ncbi:MAG: hypothetical protein ACYTF8_16895 [Planctomycetota bacterium]|jgi:hypothetical protein